MQVKIIKKNTVKQLKDCEPGFYVLSYQLNGHSDKNPTIYKVMYFKSEKYYCAINRHDIYKVLNDISEVVEVEVLNIEIAVK